MSTIQEGAVHDEIDEGRMAFHPYNVIMILVLVGVGALFLAFSAAFIYTRIQSDLPPIDLPPLFLFNTVVLLGSSATIVMAKKAYLRDDTDGYKRALLYTIVLSVVFMLLQFFAWRDMFSQSIFPHTDNSAAYLYVISGLHFAHVVAGLPFLLVFYFVARKRMQEPVSVLVYFSDPEKRLKLRMLSMYWHFLDALWIYLIIFFFINRLLYTVM